MLRTEETDRARFTFKASGNLFFGFVIYLNIGAEAQHLLHIHYAKLERNKTSAKALFVGYQIPSLVARAILESARRSFFDYVDGYHLLWLKQKKCVSHSIQI